MIADPLFYLLAVPAVVLLGFSKGGLAGVGSLAPPLIALVIEPVQAAGIMLPNLIVQDAVGVWSFPRIVCISSLLLPPDPSASGAESIG